MRKHLIQFLLVAVLSVFSAAAFAQTTVRGQLVDSETGEPLVGAAVMVEGTTQGSVTDIDGYFKQSVASNATLLFKYVGYKDQKKKIAQKGASVDLGAIQMEPDAVMLKDVVITSSVAVVRKTPVALSTVDPVYIEENGHEDFWGFTIVIIRVPEIFADSMKALSDFGYNYTLYKTAFPWESEFEEVYGSEEELKNPV